jgi:hypothetical protein
MRRVTSLTLMMVLLLLAPMSFAKADDKDKLKDKDSSSGIGVPVSGTFTDQSGGVGKFAGTLTITHFAKVNDGINAVGSIAGTLTDSQGNVVATGLQTVSLPITLSPGATAGTTQTEKPATFTKASFRPSASAVTASAPAAQLSCQILRLSIGTIDLNLLGLVVHLNPVLLIITAVPGAGNLLGNLLCAIVNLLNGGGPLAQIIILLNQLLALLGT